MISLPFKIMLFVLVDGWNLLIGSLAQSFARLNSDAPCERRSPSRD